MNVDKTIDQLSTGGPQVILALLVVALSLVCWRLLSGLLESYRDRITETKEMHTRYAEDTKLATSTLREFKQTIDLALAALKGKE